MESISQPFISIIIPTYNVESYIARCLDSCINQTLHDIEILVIDDYGSDDSIKIARSYANKDSRIRIIHNEKNLGTFQTRIQGIKHAKGSCIAFLDADDYLHLQACEALHRHTTLHNADILHFKAHYPANPNTPLLAKLTHYIRYALPTRFSKAPLYNEQIAYNFFLDSKQFPKFTLWDKCYNTTLLRQVCKCFTDSSFTPIVADDMLFFLAIVAIAKSYISIDKRLYFYCLNAQSSMQAPSKKQRRIDSFAYVANALHSLRLDSNLLPKIAETMSKNLAALIILESRLSRMHGGGDIAESQHNSTSHSVAMRQSLQDSSRSTQMTEILAPLMPLVESELIPAPKIPKYMRYIRSQYLLSCILSLQYWNRCLTYIRMLICTLSLGRIKL